MELAPTIEVASKMILLFEKYPAMFYNGEAVDLYVTRRAETGSRYYRFCFVFYPPAQTRAEFLETFALMFDYNFTSFELPSFMTSVTNAAGGLLDAVMPDMYKFPMEVKANFSNKQKKKEKRKKKKKDVNFRPPFLLCSPPSKSFFSFLSFFLSIKHNIFQFNKTEDAWSAADIAALETSTTSAPGRRERRAASSERAYIASLLSEYACFPRPKQAAHSSVFLFLPCPNFSFSFSFFSFFLFFSFFFCKA